MPLRVTFDTNVLDLACRPDRFPKNPRQAEMQVVHAALVSGGIEGFYSVTMLTIEGIMKSDRAAVFADTRITPQPEKQGIIRNEDLPPAIREAIGDGDLETITFDMRVEQPKRKPLHPEVIARMKAAKALGVKVLRAVPRIGQFNITDPTGEYYLSRGDSDDRESWIRKIHEVAGEIEARGLGYEQVKQLGLKFGCADPTATWYHALDKAADIHEERAVHRAFSEWADGDSVASHIAYGLDIFCSADVGRSNATNSVLDAKHRSWLSETYGVKFMTFEELASTLS